MNSTKKIREIFGLTQTQMATFLGISRSRLALAETNRRDLPTSALIKLSALENSLNNNVQYKQQHLQKQSGKDIAAMRSFVRTCARGAASAKLQLQQLEKEYQHCVKTLMALDHLQNSLPQDKDNKKEQLWLELLQRKTVKRLSACALSAQVKIKLKAAALEMQAAQAETMKF